MAGNVSVPQGLKGKYDIKLAVLIGGQDAGSGLGDASEPGPDIFSALEKQLGLKLAKVRASLDVIAIDHMDRMPEEN